MKSLTLTVLAVASVFAVGCTASSVPEESSLKISLGSDVSVDQRAAIERGMADWAKETGLKIELVSGKGDAFVVTKSGSPELCPLKNETDEIIPWGSEANGIICLPDVLKFYDVMFDASRRIFTHELGHVLGLHHVKSNDQAGVVMSATFATSASFLTQSDVDQYQSLHPVVK